MVEVFKTNVTDYRHAAILATVITNRFSDYLVNFDLDDCDRILRVKCRSGCVQASGVIRLLARFGYHAEVLTDDDGPRNQLQDAYKHINF